MQESMIYCNIPQQLQPQRIFFICYEVFERNKKLEWCTCCAAIFFVLLKDLLQLAQMHWNLLYPLFSWVYAGQQNKSRQRDLRNWFLRM